MLVKGLPVMVLMTACLVEAVIQDGNGVKEVAINEYRMVEKFKNPKTFVTQKGEKLKYDTRIVILKCADMKICMDKEIIYFEEPYILPSKPPGFVQVEPAYPGGFSSGTGSPNTPGGPGSPYPGSGAVWNHPQNYPQSGQPGGPPLPYNENSHLKKPHVPGMPFNFNYSVNDPVRSAHYSHNAVSDGDQVKGDYRVLLPDNRTQIVTYLADWATGYHVNVRYEGEAKNQDQGAAPMRGSRSQH